MATSVFHIQTGASELSYTTENTTGSLAEASDAFATVI